MKNFFMGTMFGSLVILIGAMVWILIAYCELSETKREKLKHEKKSYYGYRRRSDD